MKDTSLDPIFLPSTSTFPPQFDPSDLSGIHMSDLRHAVGEQSFNTVFDFLRTAAWSYIEQGRLDQAIEMVLEFDRLATRTGEQSRMMLDIHSALMQILTAIYLHADMISEAADSAASTLTLLAQEARRKDEPFLVILASLLYDVARLHDSRGEHRQAERAIEKSMKLFERLARSTPGRYGSPHLLALNASTSIYSSREKQTKALADHQIAANTYMRQVAEGVEDAGLRLVETLGAEGETLVKMNRHREAIQYFTRALKFLTKLNPEFSRRHLELSVALGEALLHYKNTRDKGVHLLNTMLYKANKIDADDLHRRIVDILLNSKNTNLDIFGFWHKLFPR